MPKHDFIFCSTGSGPVEIQLQHSVSFVWKLTRFGGGPIGFKVVSYTEDFVGDDPDLCGLTSTGATYNRSATDSSGNPIPTAARNLKTAICAPVSIHVPDMTGYNVLCDHQFLINGDIQSEVLDLSFPDGFPLDPSRNYLTFLTAFLAPGVIGAEKIGCRIFDPSSEIGGEYFWNPITPASCIRCPALCPGGHEYWVQRGTAISDPAYSDRRAPESFHCRGYADGAPWHEVTPCIDNPIGRFWNSDEHLLAWALANQGNTVSLNVLAWGVPNPFVGILGGRFEGVCDRLGIIGGPLLIPLWNILNAHVGGSPGDTASYAVSGHATTGLRINGLILCMRLTMGVDDCLGGGGEGAGGTNPFNYQDLWGRYHRTYIGADSESGQVRYKRSDFSIPPSGGFAVSSQIAPGGEDPRVLMDHRGLLYAVYAEGGVQMKRSDDDGLTWNTAETMIADATHPVLEHAPDGTLVVAGYRSGNLVGRIRHTGEPDFSEEVAFLDDEGNELEVEDDTFDLSYAYDGQQRLVLVCRIAGDGQISEWHCFDDHSESPTRLTFQRIS